VLAAFLMMAAPALAGQNQNNNAAPPELLITEVLVTFSDTGICADGADTITILGVNFDNGADPAVVLGDQGSLPVCSATEDSIVAECPNGGFCADGSDPNGSPGRLVGS
jgi:hypothetical protein